MNHEGAVALLSIWGYPAYLALFLASALGSPLTEDLLLLLGGYLVGARVFTWPLAAPIAFTGVLATDAVLYAFGRKLRQHSLRRGFIRKVVRPGRLRAATRWFVRFGDRVVFFSRLTPGTRVVVFVSAGLRGMPFGRFLLYDAIAAALWVPLLLWIGARLGEQIGGFHAALEWIGGRIFWVIAAAAVLVLLRQAWLARAQKAAGDDPTL
jgi:membrane protein DedA with SNARE-associated domain